MSLRLIGGYLHFAPALVAHEQLEAYEVQRLFHLRQHDRRRAIAEIQRVAEGQPAPTSAQRAAAKKAEWDAAWSRLRNKLGGAAPAPGRGLRPGERIVIPAE